MCVCDLWVRMVFCVCVCVCVCVSQERVFLSASNYVFTVIFVVEMLIKVHQPLALRGLFKPPNLRTTLLWKSNFGAWS